MKEALAKDPLTFCEHHSNNSEFYEGDTIRVSESSLGVRWRDSDPLISATVVGIDGVFSIEKYVQKKRDLSM